MTSKLCSNLGEAGTRVRYGKMKGWREGEQAAFSSPCGLCTVQSELTQFCPELPDGIPYQLGSLVFKSQLGEMAVVITQNLCAKNKGDGREEGKR